MKTGLLIAALLLTSGSVQALANDAAAAKGKKAATEFSKEEREQMAAHHEQMAACLRSDKSLEACRDEMRGQMGKDACPMMGPMMSEMGGMSGRGRMHRGAPKSN